MNFMIRNKTVISLHDINTRDNDAIRRHEYIAYSHLGDPGGPGPHPASSAADYLRRVHQLNEAMTRQVHKMHSLTTVAAIAGIFVFITVITTALVAVFCCKRNAVFAMPSKSDDDYEDCELDDLDLGPNSDDEHDTRSYRTFDNAKHASSSVRGKYSNNNNNSLCRTEPNLSKTCDYFLVQSQRRGSSDNIRRSAGNLDHADSTTRLVRSTSGGLNDLGRLSAMGSGKLVTMLRRNRDWFLQRGVSMKRSQTVELNSKDQVALCGLEKSELPCGSSEGPPTKWQSYMLVRQENGDRAILVKARAENSVIGDVELGDSMDSIPRSNTYQALSSDSENSPSSGVAETSINDFQIQNDELQNNSSSNKSKPSRTCDRVGNVVSNSKRFKYKQLKSNEANEDTKRKQKRAALGADLNGSMILGDVEDYQWPVEEYGLRLHGDIVDILPE